MSQQRPTLSNLKPGDTGTITGYSGVIEPHLKNRLLVLGFVPGTKVKVVRNAPLGDPVEYELRGARVSLRRTEAAHITVERS